MFLYVKTNKLVNIKTELNKKDSINEIFHYDDFINGLLISEQNSRTNFENDSEQSIRSKNLMITFIIFKKN